MPEKEGEREHDRRWREKLANRSQTAIMGAEGSMGCPCKKSVSLPWRDRETLGFSLESDDACGSLLPRDYQRQLEIRSKQMDCENTLSLPPSPSSLSLVITSESLAHSSRSTTRNHLESVVCSKTVTNRLETRLQLADFRHERERSIARFDRPMGGIRWSRSNEQRWFLAFLPTLFF